MQYVYPCVLTPEDEGGFFVSFPDVPEALTGADNRAEALAMAEDALAAALGMYVKEREDLPVPSIAVAGQALVAVPTIVAAKLALYTAMRRQGITMVVLAERLGLSEGAVRRLCDPDHRSHIGRVEDALRAVGRNLVVGDRAVQESPPPRPLHDASRSRNGLDALLSSDFVGCGEGPHDLASRYKQYLTRDLEHKHDAG